MTIRVRSSEQQCAAANLNGSVKFSFLQQRMSEAVTSEKMIRMQRQRLLIMSDGVVNPTLLNKGIAQSNLSIRVRWPHADRPFTVGYRLIRLTFSHKRGT